MGCGASAGARRTVDFVQAPAIEPEVMLLEQSAKDRQQCREAGTESESTESGSNDGGSSSAGVSDGSAGLMSKASMSSYKSSYNRQSSALTTLSVTQEEFRAMALRR